MSPPQSAAQRQHRTPSTIDVEVAETDAVPAADDTEKSLGTRVDKPLRGILLVVCSTIFLASSDAMSKYLSVRLPSVEIAWLRYAVYALIMCPAVLAAPRRTLAATRPGLQLLRGFAMLSSSLLFITGLRFLPVAEATTTSFISPLLVTALSIMFLGETVGIRRWLATLTGLIGVMIVVRPGTSAFHVASLLPLSSATCWACALVTTRMIAGRDAPVTTMVYSAIVGLILLSFMLPFVWITPTPQELAIGVAIGVSATLGHWFVVQAYRYGNASVLAPLSYSQLIWATILGYAIFGNVPDTWTFIGAAVIVASGLYTAHRERVRSMALVC